MNSLRSIAKNIRMVLGEKQFAGLFFLLWILFFSLMYVIPVRLIPGNNIRFQTTVYSWDDYFQLGMLSMLSAMILTMQAAIFRRNRNAIKSSASMVGGVGILSGIFSSMFASASCALCIGGLLGFLGGNTLVFLVDNRNWIFFIGFSLLLISLHLSSKRLDGVCEKCKSV